LLAAVGLYGVLDYSVIQRRREIAIRVAIGAGFGELVRRVSVGTLGIVSGGVLAGFTMGLVLVRHIESLIYQVRLTDFAVVAVPAATILGTAVVAMAPAVMRALRIDPAAMLRVE
jgi:ABC-type antimicrobial peptide transport system permease subunit